MCLPELGFAQAKNPYQHYTHSPHTAAELDTIQKKIS